MDANKLVSLASEIFVMIAKVSFWVIGFGILVMMAGTVLGMVGFKPSWWWSSEPLTLLYISVAFAALAHVFRAQDAGIK